MNSVYPIGVFDSGVGGLSVLRDIRRELAHEDLLYVADSVHAPYGDKTAAFIESRSIAIAQFLLNQQVKAIVVACNTATAAAVAALRARFPVPIIAMEPAVKPAVSQTKSGVVGVMATRRTVASENFLNLLERFGGAVEIVVQPCPGLVEQVEAGDLSGAATQTLLREYVLPLLERGADTIVLGCTHYPFLAPLIQQLAGSAVAILDPGEAIARELRRRLDANGLLCREPRLGVERFWTSDSPDKAQALLSCLWGQAVEAQLLPEPYRLPA
ncbi:MAG: glutamate racemase [Candidatus Methylumidiphilus sp.]